MKVADCMTPEPVCLEPHDSLNAATHLMDAGDFRAVPVISKGKLVGIVSDRDIRKHWHNRQDTEIGAIMSENPICISPEDSINEAIRMLLSHKIGGLPVIGKDKLVGIFTTTDVLKTVLGFPQLD
jgi:acetoin utilization protein AcuB